MLLLPRFLGLASSHDLISWTLLVCACWNVGSTGESIACGKEDWIGIRVARAVGSGGDESAAASEASHVLGERLEVREMGS